MKPSLSWYKVGEQREAAEFAMTAFLTFWGKAHPVSPAGAQSHPAAFHSLDVAAVCERLLEIRPHLAHALAEQAGADRPGAALLLVQLAALHDIGKFSIGFQAKVPALFPAVLGVAPALTPTGDHTRIGHHLLWNAREAELSVLAPAIDAWAWAALLPAVAGHHGRPVAGAPIHDHEVGRAAIAAARGFLAQAVAAFGSGSFAGGLEEGPARILSWRLAGLVTLADWIGSNQAQFPYEPPQHDLSTYLDRIARPRAVEAVRAAGIDRAMVSGVSTLAALTGRELEPSPLQAFAETMPLPAEGPVLALIEDVTGAGKTEAALILAHRLMRLGAADGMFVALPTMATANAMYDRLGDVYRRLFAAEATPSLVLAHGARSLHPGFRSSIVAVGRSERRLGPGDDLTASAACAAWIADDRRKAFFADVGVGTLDQAFLAVLPAKFAPLRLHGLSRKVLVVDEAHAYDAYMGEELGRLVQFHAAQGGATIVLSATLPEGVKDGLLRAFRAGTGCRLRPEAWPPAYPLATVVGADGAAACTPLATRPDLPRRLPVRRLADAEAACAEIEVAARAGAAVAYVRNTVDDALVAHAALAGRGLDVVLYHARFAMGDRLDREREVIATFGRASGPADRRGRIVVATQVVEQSLDLDFDLLVTDLAPVDLMIQRAGRLWRHGRSDRPLSAPELLVVSPEAAPDAGVEWYRAAFPKAAHVYENHALLWQSARALFAAGAIVSPGGVRPLVGAVYGKDALADVPAALEGRRNAAEGKASAEKSQARLNLLVLAGGYQADNGAWDAETRTPTRLGDPRTIVRLARVDGTADRPALSPWVAVEPEPGESPYQALRRAWALSEVSVAVHRITGRGTCAPAIEAAAVTLESEWREVGDAAVVMPLSLPEGAAQWLGQAKGEDDAETLVEYDYSRGLTFRRLPIGADL